MGVGGEGRGEVVVYDRRNCAKSVAGGERRQSVRLQDPSHVAKAVRRYMHIYRHMLYMHIAYELTGYLARGESGPMVYAYL